MSSTSRNPPPGGSPKRWDNKLRIDGELGRGGMSKVLQGTDTKLRRTLALKVALTPTTELPADHLARFVEEAQITAQLEHPNVVPIHEIGVDPEGHLYFSMKLVRGRSLEEILESRRAGDAETLEEFGLRRLLDVFLQVCQAIEYAHARGVIHRDLKPSNIMVGGFGEVLVMDWGVAKLVEAQGSMEAVSVRPTYDAKDSLPPPLTRSTPPPATEVSSIRSGKRKLATQRGAVIGTPAYMSPEQARGEAAGERADAYALGAILYEILCGQLPIDDDDTEKLLAKVVSETPRPPSEVNPATPAALEALAMRLLEKSPEQRLSIPDIRRHLQNYLEGVERDYRRESLWTSALWALGGVALFAFLVWYLTGQAITALFVLAPSTIFNSVGWFLLIVAARYPLWSFWLALKRGRTHPDPFGTSTIEDSYVSGFLAHRTFAATAASLFQLVFLLELVFLVATEMSRGVAVTTDRVLQEVRAGWGRALIVILLFLFAYLFLLHREARHARRVDRYEMLVQRPRLESAWPVFLVMLLLVTIVMIDVFDRVVVNGVRPIAYLQQVLTQPISALEIVKALVLQATFLMGLVFVTVTIAFRFPEVLASLRLPYQPADQAAVHGRSQYFLRSLAVFRVARASWLYGGAIIGCLTALAVLSRNDASPLLARMLYVLGPSLFGYIGYWLTRRQLLRLLKTSQPIDRMLQRETAVAEVELDRARVEQLENAPLHWRLSVLLVPVACIAGLLAFTESGFHRRAIEQLVMPTSSEGWLLIVPYALLLPTVLFGDALRLRLLRRKLARVEERH